MRPAPCRDAMHRPVLALCLALALAPAAAAAVSPAFGAPGEPRFDAYPADPGLKNANNAGEPTIGIPWNTDHAFFQAFASTYRVAFDDHQAQGGRPAALWQDASPAFTAINVDPMLHADHVSNRVWAGGLAGPCSVMGMSDNDGFTWVPAGNMCTFAQFDHQSIGSGAWSASSPLPQGAVYGRATDYCAQLQLGTRVGDTPGTACTTSPNGGLTWLPFVEVLGGCGGLHGHIRVSETTGTAAVPDGSCHSGEGSTIPGGVVTSGPNQVGFGFTTDNGASWGSRTVPTSATSDGFDPSLDFSRQSGWIYVAQADRSGLHVALSKNEGQAWEQLGGATPGAEPAVWLNLSAAYHDPRTGAPLKYGAFADVLAGDDERAAVSFLGTTAVEGNHPFGDPETDVTGQNYLHSCPKDADPNVWHYYVAQTFDGGQRWSITRLWEDPVQVGSIWNGGGGEACRNLLDFADMDMDSHGRLHVAFADGCIRKCAAAYANWTAGKGDAPKGTSSRDSYATILRQTTGLGLFAKDDGMNSGLGTPTETGPSQDMPSIGPVATLAALAVGLAFLRRRRA
jgi:MYXO-CTERM domain-containing protein